MSVEKKIWFTTKARMNAEVRYKTYNSILNWLVILYSFSLIATALYNLGTGHEEFATPLVLLLNIATFTTACMTFAGNFSGKAAEFRECYLRLDRLLSGTNDNLDEQYHELLAGYQNHHQMDYLKIIITERIRRKRSVLDAKDQKIILTPLSYLGYFSRKLMFWITVGLFFAVPIWITLRLVFLLVFQTEAPSD